MTPLDAALRRVADELVRVHVPFALVGGLAVSVRTEPRFTRDADLAVALATDAEAEALIHALRARGYGIGAIVEQEAVGRLATVRLTFSREPQVPVVDLLFASSGIESEVVADAEPLDLLSDLRLRVARTGHLMALKVLSRDDGRRPQDLIDLRALITVASPDELARARAAVDLIAARGFHRGRDVVADLRRVMRPAD